VALLKATSINEGKRIFKNSDKGQISSKIYFEFNKNDSSLEDHLLGKTVNRNFYTFLDYVFNSIII